MKNIGTAQIEAVRHSLAHLLAASVLKKFPKVKLGVGPVIESGFYYDFKLPGAISEADLKEFEKSMREFIAQKIYFKGEKVTPAKARALFKNQPFKLDLVKDFTKEKKPLTVYRTGEFLDLCRGGHVKNTSEIDPDAFALIKTAGAYWKGNEKNPQLTRIYGVAFATKEELGHHLAMLEEAKKRDHKKLGPELGLFVFSDLVGPGLPLWTPKGTALRDVLDNFVWSLRASNGYERVDIPHLAKRALYEKSGHWDKFLDEIFRVTSREGHEFALKPMNCPHHTQLYAAELRSWRDLPIRYANTTKVYRDEQTGELAGLSRVRAITQDDAHVFCRESQIEEEMDKILGMIEKLYQKVGIGLSTRLSFRDTKDPKKYLGTASLWERAESTLKKLVKERDIEAEEKVGEAAFYGPKMDFIAKDSLGREWQVATMQLDMNLPERFDLACINERGEKERIVMIHAAIMGSIERFVAMLIEHYAGAFPYWLAPVQVKVLSVNDDSAAYAGQVLDDLHGGGIRAELDDRKETIGKKIREGELKKIPYLLIVGPKESESRTVSVRARGKGDEGALPLEGFLEKVRIKEV